MDAGLYTSVAGMQAQETRMNAISNDIANLSTTGYESTQVGFQDLLYSQGGSSSGSAVATGAGSAAQIVGRSQTQGALQTTGRPLDIAIQGPGYLQIRHPDGSIGLTRNGTLQLDARGRITDDFGDPLEPPISVPAGTSEDSLKIAGDGTVSAAGRSLGKIAIVDVPAPAQLLSSGNSTFTATAASGAARAAVGSSLQQGSLESSNVDLANEMSQLIDTEKSYSMTSEAIQIEGQMMQVANQVKN
jgi:flagellar basal-body rod protein FlgG